MFCARRRLTHDSVAVCGHQQPTLLARRPAAWPPAILSTMQNTGQSMPLLPQWCQPEAFRPWGHLHQSLLLSPCCAARAYSAALSRRPGFWTHDTPLHILPICWQ